MIGIWLGDSFAEMSAETAGGKPGAHLSTTRWLHSKKPVSDVLRETLVNLRSENPEASGEIHVATSRAEMAVTRRHGSEPVALVTAGFETWGKLWPRKVSEAPSLRAEREWFPTSPEKVFGVDERILADGTIERELKTEDLETLHAKFELLKSKEIAICFMHGARFSAHEKQAAAFFRERGFKVVVSHELLNATHLSESERIRRTVESSFAEALVQEDFESLRKVLEEEKLDSNWKLRFWTREGLGETPSAAFVRGGVEKAISLALPPDIELGYFFGLEEFVGFKRGIDGALTSYLLPVQPTCQIGASSWPFPSWTSVDRGYEPGPMLFGKSHQLTFLDVLFVLDRLKAGIEAFSDRIQPKSSARILETLLTLGRNLVEPGRSKVDAKDIAEDLEMAFVEKIAMDLSFGLRKTSRVVVAGPLAFSVLPMIEQRRPDVTFIADPELTVSAAAIGKAR